MVERPPPPDLPTRPSSPWRTLRRSTVYAAIGVLGVAYEAVVATEVRPALLVVYGAMMGLPPVLAANEMAKRWSREEDRR